MKEEMTRCALIAIIIIVVIVIIAKARLHYNFICSSGERVR